MARDKHQPRDDLRAHVMELAGWAASLRAVGLGHARRARKPSVRTMIAQAEKAGKVVTSIVTPDGTALTFGEPSPAQRNSWDDLETGTRQ